MLGKIRSSLVIQNNFLFSISILFISIIWFIFYVQQKHQNEEHNIARYFNVATTLHPLILGKKEISDEMLLSFDMEKYKGELPFGYRVYLERGTQQKGFRFIRFK